MKLLHSLVMDVQKFGIAVPIHTVRYFCTDRPTMMVVASASKLVKKDIDSFQTVVTVCNATATAAVAPPPQGKGKRF